MPPGARERLVAALAAALSEVVAGVRGAPRVVLRARLRDFVVDLPPDRYVSVEDFAAGALCALAGDPGEPTHVASAVVATWRLLASAYLDAPPPVAFAPLKDLLDARPVDPAAVRAWFRRTCGRCTVAPRFR